MALAYDGTVVTGQISGAAASTIVSAAFTNGAASDVNYAIISTSENAGFRTVSSVAGGGLTWTRANSNSGVGSNFNSSVIEIWTSVGKITAGAVTATLSGTATAGAIIVGAVSGADTTTPLDVNASSKPTNQNLTGTASAPTLTISTTNANTVLIGGVMAPGAALNGGIAPTPPSGFTQSFIAAFSGSPNFLNNDEDMETEIVAAAQTGVAITWGSTSGNWIAAGIAIQQASAGGATLNFVSVVDSGTFRPAKPQRGAAIARGDDGTEITKINWFNAGWEIQPPPPPHQPREKRGAILPRDDGNELPKINWLNIGSEIQPPPPPHTRVESRGAVLPRDDGNQLPKINWFNGGWEVQSVQPPAFPTANLANNNVRAASLAGGDPGIGNRFVNWINAGAEIQPVQPPRQKWEARGAILLGDPGHQGRFENWRNSGWEIASPHTPHPRPERSGSLMRGDDGAQAAQINFFPAGFEAVLHQPSHPRPERSGAWMAGDDGDQNPFRIVTTGWGFDPFPVYLALRPTIQQRGSGASGDSAFAAFSTDPWTDDLAGHWQRPRRINAAMLGDPGHYFPTSVVTIVTSSWGFDAQPWQPPHRQARGGTIARGDDGTQFSAINFFAMGFEALLHQPGHPRPERAGAIMAGDGGISFPSTVVAVTYNWGFEAPPWQPSRQIYRASTLPWGDDGDQSPFILFRPSGFEIAPFQPPHPRFEQRAAGFLRGDEGNQDILRSWFNAGWEVAPYQPQHVAYARAGAIMFGDDGTESVYVFIPPAVGTSTWRTLMGVGI